jgi:chorismate mutase
MPIRGVRGAITVDEDQPQLILEATHELILAILEANPGMQPEELASVIFTTTQDLDSAFPANAARQLGWDLVPMLCAREIPVPGSMPRCIRLLLHWNTALTQAEVRHVYLRDAISLRPDLSPEKAANGALL